MTETTDIQGALEGRVVSSKMQKTVTVLATTASAKSWGLEAIHLVSTETRRVRF